MIVAALLLALVPFDAPASSASLVNVSATWAPPARPGGDAAVVVGFQTASPDIQVDREPAPRLVLDPAQTAVVQKAAPAAPRKTAPAAALPASSPDRYIGTLPIYFPVTVKTAQAKGATSVKGTVTYFYCSTGEGWCRKGTADVVVDVPAR